MAQIDVKDQSTSSKNFSEQNETNNGRISAPSDGTGSMTTGTNSAKSSIRELLQNQKTPHRRKSKSQNRARKALRTITFILGKFLTFHHTFVSKTLFQVHLLFVGHHGKSSFFEFLLYLIVEF
jgi:hypothetical protein